MKRALLFLAACGSDPTVVLDAPNAPDGSIEPPDGSIDAPDPCAGAALCAQFDDLPSGALTNNATIGAFRAEVQTGGTLAIDSARAYSGTHSLKAHIDGGGRGGGRLFASGGPLFATTQRHLYGRFMLWNTTDANSVHWTIFGASGEIPDGPSAGHTGTYLFSAADDKKFMAVFYDNQTQQDCWHHADEPIPVATDGEWTCVTFEADAEGIRYRLGIDGRPIDSFDVNTTGDGCLNAPGDTPWYGPAFDRFYLGALSFHPMSGPLDVWFDDLVVSTTPVACPL